MRGHKAGVFIFTFVVLLATWFLITGSVEIQEVLFGVAVALGVAAATAATFTEQGLAHLPPRRLLYLLVVANLDVVYRVLSPSLPIKPGFVIAKTKLKTDSGKLALANSITLTPGTIVADVVGNELLVHWIYVKEESVDGATSSIVGPFEKWLEVIFG